MPSDDASVNHFSFSVSVHSELCMNLHAFSEVAVRCLLCIYNGASATVLMGKRRWSFTCANVHMCLAQL